MPNEKKPNHSEHPHGGPPKGKPDLPPIPPGNGRPQQPPKVDERKFA